MIPLAVISGAEFLVGYAIAFLIANLWAASSRKRHREAISSTAPAHTEDPYELAFLAGGARRVAQVAVVRLILEGHIEWQPKWTGARLVARSEAATTAPTSRIEADLASSIAAAGKGGLKVDRLMPLVAPLVRPFEVRLATRGLRPTAAERASGAFAAIWPLILLIVVGVFRIAIGVGRDKPVGFLIAAVILTVLVAAFWGKRGGYLTPAGKERLDTLREKHRDRKSMSFPKPADHLPEIAIGTALFGTSAVAALPGVGPIHQEIHNAIGTSTTQSQAGSSGCGGCSSGCGSGCGGGGCGGCGD